ncbi:hypothetical protein BD413DRAFT_652145 [Trametes elegans]|nr:hypothetical protein BD413DRAFT_652145 [Trametes elegans]
MGLASVPQTAWRLYLDHLVYYQPGSWVDSAANTCRVLAFVAVVPFILLTLLDVASYVIARTLGVIDATKASTSGGPDAPDGTAASQPTIVIQDDSSFSSSASLSPTLSPASASAPFGPGGHSAGTAADGRHGGLGQDSHPPASYFPTPDPAEEEGNLRLAGVGTFSPAPSQPGSPTLQRREFVQHQHQHHRAGSDDGDGEEDERRGGSGAATPRGAGGSSSGDSSFALLDRDSGSNSGGEDADADAGVVLRRRARRPGPGAEDGAA